MVGRDCISSCTDSKLYLQKELPRCTPKFLYHSISSQTEHHAATARPRGSQRNWSRTAMASLCPAYAACEGSCA
eukprot:3619135-Prymnesium_polylepis.1